MSFDNNTFEGGSYSVPVNHGGITDTPVSSWGNQSNDVYSNNNTQAKVVRVTSADLVDRPNLGVMATALDSDGRPTVTLKENGTIEYQGLRMEASIAERMGLLRKDSNGNYQPTSSTLTKPEEFQQRDQQRSIEQMTPEQRFGANLQQLENEGGYLIGSYQGEAAIANFVEPVPQHMFDKAAAVINDTGNLDAVDWQSLGEASGMSAHEARQRAEIIDAMVTNSAINILASEGVSVEDHFFREYLSKHNDQAKKAMADLFYNRDPRGVRQFAQESSRNSLPPQADFEAAGYRTRHAPNGDLLVKVGNEWHSAKDLAKRGAIKWS